MTLHDAISEVLTLNGEPMKCGDIAKEVNRLKLYTRPKDGKPAEYTQIRARANNYSSMFTIKDAKVHLKRWGTKS